MIATVDGKLSEELSTVAPADPGVMTVRASFVCHESEYPARRMSPIIEFHPQSVDNGQPSRFTTCLY